MNQVLRTRTALALTLGVLCSAPARADFYLHHWTDQHESSEVLSIVPEVSYYFSQTNYDAQGIAFAPAGLQGVGVFLADGTAKYGITSRITVFARASWSFVRLDSATDPQAGTTFNFRDQSAGANFRILDIRPFHTILGYTVDIQAQADIPLYSNTAAARLLSGPFIGDSSMDFTGGLFVSAPIVQGTFGALGATVGGGFTYRTGGFSSALPYSLGLKFIPVERGFFASAEGLGILSLKTDLKTGITGPASTISPGAGGSFLVNAINPSLFTTRLSVGYQLSNSTKVYLAGSTALFGDSAPAGIQGMLGAELRLGSVSSRDPIHLSPKEYGRSNQGLQSYSLDAHVLKASDRLNLVKIDRGSQDGVEVGQLFDIFIVNNDGSAGEAVARAKVVSVKGGETALSVLEYFKEVWIDEGFLAKRLIP